MKDTQSYASQFELLKIVAELNHEMLFDYDVDRRVGHLSKVQNGRFVIVREETDCDQHIWDSFVGEIYEEDIPVLRKVFESLKQRPSQNVVEFRLSLEQEDKKWYRFFLVSEALKDGSRVDHIAGRLVCVDQEKQINEINRKKAELDALTGVYNHMTFENTAEKKLLKHKSEVIFIMLDIDDFKLINDTQGHSVGDMVISQTGEVFQRMVEGRGIAGRLGGDEFAALVWNFHSDDEIREYMKKFQSELKTIIFDLEYSASIGVSIRHERNISFADMYYEADQGAYFAKKNGKNQVIYFDDINKIREDESLEVSQNITYEDSKAKAFADEREMILILDYDNYQVKYANRSFLEYFHLTEEEALTRIKMGELLNMTEEELDFLQKQEKYLQIQISPEDNEFYRSRQMSVDVIVVTRRLSWEGKNAIILSMLPSHDKEGLIQLLNRRSQVNNILLKTIEIISSGKNEERGPQALKLLVDFYDADCIAVMVRKFEDGKERLIEAHKEHASTNARLLREVVENGGGELFEETFPEEGIVYVPDISVYKDAFPEAYEQLLELRIWSSAVCRLRYQGEYCGKFLLINPRKHVEQRTMLHTITDLIAAELLRAKKEIIHEYEMKHDMLTGFRLRDTLAEIKEFWNEDLMESVGVVYTDIINMREINGKFGYLQGNDFLKETADIVRRIFDGYYLFRYEQDCLLVICKDVDQQMFDTMVCTLKERLGELAFGVAVGYSWGRYQNLQDLINESKRIMAADKQLQKYDNSAKAREQAMIKENITREITMGNFLVYLQPKVNIRTNELCGAEALCRLRDKVRGIVGPAMFIPILEQLELVYMIDLFVLEEVFRFQRRRIESGMGTVPISVNISKNTLLYPDLITEVSEMVEKYDIPTELIEIEITESVGDMDHVLVSKIAKSLHTMGFSLAMDDFGTQYSNLAMLSQFEFDVAKIDRSIVKDIKENPKSMIILKHLTSMIRELGISCMVEGVETTEDLERIKETDCDIVQGYCFGKPVPKADFEEIFMA